MWGKLHGSPCLCKIIRSYYEYGHWYYEFRILRLDDTFQHFLSVDVRLIDLVEPTPEELTRWMVLTMKS